MNVYSDVVAVHSVRTPKITTVTGNILLQTFNTTGFGKLLFGGTTNAFPALVRNGSTITLRLADNSNYANIEVGNITVHGSVVGIDALPTQTGQSGKYLKTNGTTASWATVIGGGSQNIASVLDEGNDAVGESLTNLGSLSITGPGGISYGYTQLNISVAVSEVGASLHNTGTGGRDYRIFSTNNSSDLGGGKFVVADATTGRERFSIDANGVALFDGVITGDGSGLSNVHASAVSSYTDPGAIGAGALWNRLANNNGWVNYYGQALYVRNTDNTGWNPIATVSYDNEGKMRGLMTCGPDGNNIIESFDGNETTLATAIVGNWWDGYGNGFRVYDQGYNKFVMASGGFYMWAYGDGAAHTTIAQDGGGFLAHGRIVWSNSGALTINVPTADTGVPVLKLGSLFQNNDHGSALQFNDSQADIVAAQIRSVAYDPGVAGIVVDTNNGTGLAERLRIDPAGNVIAGGAVSGFRKHVIPDVSAIRTVGTADSGLTYVIDTTNSAAIVELSAGALLGTTVDFVQMGVYPIIFTYDPEGGYWVSGTNFNMTDSLYSTVTATVIYDQGPTLWGLKGDLSGASDVTSISNYDSHDVQQLDQSDQTVPGTNITVTNLQVQETFSKITWDVDPIDGPFGNNEQYAVTIIDSESLGTAIDTVITSRECDISALVGTDRLYDITVTPIPTGPYSGGTTLVYSDFLNSTYVLSLGSGTSVHYDQTDHYLDHLANVYIQDTGQSATLTGQTL